MPIRLLRKYQIEAAHRLPNLPADHKCSRLHGHSFQIELVVGGEVDPKLGWVLDYAEIDTIFQPFFDQLDHHYLNEVEGLENPTSENLARWIFERLDPSLPGLEEVRVSETCSESCIYSRN